MIPKNIFQSWFTKDLHPVIQAKIDEMKKLNPDYNHTIYTDEDMDNFVKEHYPGTIYDCFSKLNIIVAKVDFWRYLVLYKYGGVYLDMDSSINISLKDLINDDDECIITKEGNPNLYVQWALIYNANHPILKKVIDLVVDNIQNNSFPNDIHKMTGPTVYRNALCHIHKNLYDEDLNWSQIHDWTDKTYEKNNIKYRIFSKDYKRMLSFKYREANLLYINKKHWRTEEKQKPLLKE